jgi:hypothetical protein
MPLVNPRRGAGLAEGAERLWDYGSGEPGWSSQPAPGWEWEQ